jgi:hypothetical protein
MEITGKIKVVGAQQQVSPTFVKRELVVATDELYPQSILIEFIQDKVDLLDKYKVGDNVTVSINIRGREWQSPQGEVKYFNSIRGWRVQSNAVQPHHANHPTNQPPATQAPPQPYVDPEANDDLPF